MGLFDSIFGKSSSQKRDEEHNRELAEKAAVRQGFLSGLALEQGEEQKARLAALEQGRFQLRGLLGAPGTYDLPGAPTTTTTTPPATPDSSTIWATQTRDQTAKALVPELRDYATFRSYFDKARTGIIDPNASAAQVAGTADFRIMSRLTAEAEQALAKTGPLYDSFSQSVMGPIIEGAAQTYKDSIDIINQNAAKGGSARRVAVSEAARINALEQSNRARSQELWQANLALQAYFRDRAIQQVASNEAFLDSVYRDQYANAMTAAGNFIAGTAIPIAQEGTNQIVALQRKEIRDKSNWLGNLLLGGISAAGAYLAGNSSSPFSFFS